ncbi:MAG: DNA cytosine methyltransferase [Rubrimonas sp.]|uniref:DNA cytosine methyltransferase n=1 Tax=Rubrimonas sp. TaxID=2036015 RepID=UPI002FDEF66E
MNAPQHLVADGATDRPRFGEFFAGAGMVRAGLGPGWTCAFANDLDPTKLATYRANWGDAHLREGDIWGVDPSEAPGRLDLAWASFPCQDLSLAGFGRGLGREADAAPTRSGAFWGFWRLMRALGAEGRAPKVIALENVVGALTSHGGRDFAALAAALAAEGYRFGAFVADARAFLPQSRPRMFAVATAPDVAVPEALRRDDPDPRWHTGPVLRARAALDPATAGAWVWWRLPAPDCAPPPLDALIDADTEGVRWHSPEETARLIGLMAPLHRAKLDAARAASRASGGRVVGTIYRRTRPGPDGVGRQRVEIRFDGTAGCLRTPAGGSSRQTLALVEDGRARTRLLSAREAARLMGLPDDFRLPARYTDAYRVAGDGVAAPVVRFLAESLLEPLLAR